MDKVIEEAKKYYKNDINCYNAFLHGVEWCEDNFMEDSSISISNHKSHWISVDDDLPCNHKELINPDDKRDTLYVVAVIRGHIIFSRMYKLEGKWSWENDEPTYWMPIPELPKE